MVISAFFGSKAKLKFKRSCILGILFVSRDEGWSGFRNQRNFCLWNMDSWASESGIQFKGSGIALTIGIRNPRSADIESGIHSVEFRI